MTNGTIEIIPVTGIGEVTAGADMASLIHAALEPSGGLQERDVVVVTHKVVSKAEGRTVAVTDDAAEFSGDVDRGGVHEGLEPCQLDLGEPHGRLMYSK